MNRDAIRDRANELGIRTAKYKYAENMAELDKAIQIIGFPCIVKPVMSSSGKGQTLVTEITESNYAGTTGTLTLVGRNFDWIGASNSSTDIKSRMDASKLTWDINGDNATTANKVFSNSDISNGWTS